MREHYTQLYAQKFDNLGEINVFLKKQDNINNMNSFITIKEIEFIN